ncbi:inhibitor of growth protein 3-like [Dreissena polymorpha]|uniref:inhibitor of growth protein 3-like n=1 Tax=Dreissena polymorpha TaxID=45954 RepID=UPI0022641517|nr:inhibitor of growth protein 3-like [Dreissena polymorpha]
MLYLEDYLEMIENLPMEMRERLTEMREMDLQVQNALDGLDERVSSFFKKCNQPNVKSDWREEQFGKIKKDYYKTLEDADEKVQLANHVYDLVDRHLRKLDQELSKFKMELEADNAGITEVLEKRSLEMDKPPAQNHRVEKRKLPMSVPPVQQEKRLTTEKVLSSLANEIARDSFGPVRKSQSASSSPNLAMFNSVTPTSNLAYKVGVSAHLGTGSNAAIQAAASQAIAATQQVMQSQGRRTPSMKASYVAMTKGASSTDLSSKDYIKQDFMYTSQPSTPSVSAQDSAQGRSQRQKKYGHTSKAAALLQAQQTQHSKQNVTVMSALSQQLTAVDTTPTPAVEPTNELQIVDENGETVNWQDDPNEPRYCLCNQVSYGEMVGCDNDDCPIEWFHYGCVGLSQAPKGKWYCPQCTAAMKRRGRR